VVLATRLVLALNTFAATTDPCIAPAQQQRSGALLVSLSAIGDHMEITRMNYSTEVWLSQYDPAIVVACFVAAGLIVVVGIVYVIAYNWRSLK
jgi:hypothetical protein